MAVAFRVTVGREACAVRDDVFAAMAALSQLRYRPAPRELGHNGGWHSNAAESEISCLQRRVCSRCGGLQTRDGKPNEGT
eukprot:1886732-Alexandrium_andersonii.AAC.1